MDMRVQENGPVRQRLRILIGASLIVGGFLSILPIFGLWMLPLGLIVLSVDVPWVRRMRRRLEVWFHRRFPNLAAKFKRKSAENAGAPPPPDVTTSP
jgi:hypothetical protein